MEKAQGSDFFVECSGGGGDNPLEKLFSEVVEFQERLVDMTASEIGQVGSGFSEKIAIFLQRLNELNRETREKMKALQIDERDALAKIFRDTEGIILDLVELLNVVR